MTETPLFEAPTADKVCPNPLKNCVIDATSALVAL